MGYPDMMRDIMAQARREDLAALRKALEDRPIIDRATGLYSRDYFNLRLDEEMTRSRMYGKNLSLILIDAGLSRRDGNGGEDPTAEKTVQLIAGFVGDCLKDTVDLAFAYDTGKFAVILPEANMYEALMTADHIRETIIQEALPGVSPQAGIAQFRDHESVGELIGAAEEALHGHVGAPTPHPAASRQDR
jgi:diguanylate cyclase (GGDEF)-like protein